MADLLQQSVVDSVAELLASVADVALESVEDKVLFAV